MRNLKSKISIALASVLILSTPVIGFAGKGNDKGKFKDEVVNEIQFGQEDGQAKGKGKELNKEWEAIKDQLEADKDAVETEKNLLESEIEALEEQYEAAVENGNLETAEQLRIQIQEKMQEKNQLKAEMKNIKNQMKEVIRNRYTLEEWEQLQEAAEELAGQDEEITVLSVENIITEDADVKFDTPPVIKEGRTLIPVRAITEGFGATVDWNPEEKKVTITKGDTEIILQIDNNTAIVNGEEVQIDVPSNIYCNRTYVPLRFILETFKLTVEYDEEDKTIEIEEEETDTTEETDETTVGETNTVDENTTDTSDVTDETATTEETTETTTDTNTTDTTETTDTTDTTQTTGDTTTEQTKDTTTDNTDTTETNVEDTTTEQQ